MLTIYLVDDGSTDGTAEAVLGLWPSVNLITGNGNLFWAGGMRLAWETALNSANYDSFLLLNDDVVVENNLFEKILNTHAFCVSQYKTEGIYVGATKDAQGKLTYTGHKVSTRLLRMRMEKLIPGDKPMPCDLANANILYVTNEVLDKLGILDANFTHGLADYDYTWLASRSGFPVLIMPGFAGVCEVDHGPNWKQGNVPLKKRIAYLYSPKGLSYAEYRYFLRKHCPACLPYHVFMLWLKTIFPIFWEKFKRQKPVA